MDSCSGRDDHGRLMFKSKTPLFFKIILDDAIRDGKFRIPRKFVRLYGNDLPNSVFLTVPTGAKWKLALVKSDGEVWFQEGWLEFVKYYSLAHGSLLVFEYNQTNYEFNVTIFDMSTLEIDYPLNITTDRDNEETNLEKELQEQEIHKETETDVSVETVTCVPLMRRAKGEPPLLFPQPPNKKIKLEKSAEKEEGKRGQDSMFINERSRSLTAKEKAEALERAAANFKSENPSFMIPMQPTYLHSCYRLSIPVNFVKKYFNKERGNAILSTIDGTLWPVVYKYYIFNGISYVRMNQGWKEFAKDNHLEIGDVCVFELIDRTNTRLKVAIFQPIKEANKSMSLGNNKKLKHEEKSGNKKTVHRRSCSKSVEAVDKFTSDYPFFKANMPSRLTSVNIPFEFVKKCTKKSTENAWLQTGNRKWGVKLISHPSYSKGLLSAGFAIFAKENSLEPRDVCIFELIDAKKLLLKVSIFRNKVK
ncbi:B3 domain-containing transcription factor VRN1-like isoform X2 [Mercurialis annua]|uniref:B3 domain-containing transcription factor VRN1-like isoform X2 n=1 Tax=Mercurialis annua TaxID=3986 RepID=UPI00215FE18F|nr:B3 domain-containing transcription factor VRN1-like isoform X2 [Mercurialis annua]